jgi:site-specific recombinase XerD
MTGLGFTAANPAANLPRPHVIKDEAKTPALTRDQALALLAAADEAASPMAVRNAALTAVLLYTGARVSEVCAATTGDLGVDGGRRVLRVTSMEEDRPPLSLPAAALARLDAYLAARADTARAPAPGSQPTPPAPLFAAATGRALRPADVWNLIRRLGRAAALPPELVMRMGPDSLRHTFAVLYLEAGGNLPDLQAALGYKDLRAAGRYGRARSGPGRPPGDLLATYLARGEHDDQDPGGRP